MANRGITDIVDLPSGSVFIPVTSSGSHRDNPRTFLVTKGRGVLEYATAHHVPEDRRDKILITDLQTFETYLHKRGQGFNEFKVIESALTLNLG